MTRIDFYVLQTPSADERLQFAARLIEKAWTQQCRVVIQAADNAMAAAIDDLLWHFKPEAFIPHTRETVNADPIVIRSDNAPPPHQELLINLADQALDGFEKFQRVAEIVIQTPAVLEATRRQYSAYRERGFTVNTHKLP